MSGIGRRTGEGESKAARILQEPTGERVGSGVETLEGTEGTVGDCIKGETDGNCTEGETVGKTKGGTAVVLANVGEGGSEEKC
jgi:hypothetical protein